RYGAGVPAGALPWPGGVSGALLLGGLTVAAALAMRRRAVRLLVTVVAAAAVVGVVPVRLVASGWPPAGWVFVACAVGQGDTGVLAAGPDRAVVVDAGPDPVEVDRCLRRLGVRRIPLLVISHYHADHVGGVAGVFRGRRVDAVVTTAWPEPAGGRELVARVASAHGSPVRPVAAGWSYAAQGLRFTAIGPPQRLTGTRSDPNNNSLVIRASVGGVTVLLAGDAEGEEQRAMRDHVSGVGLRADVLKLAHHGSAYQDRGFLDAVDPAVAFVSVGSGNRYGHPNPGVLVSLARDGARVLRTDVDGDLAAVRTDRGLAVVARGPEPGGRRP
ncbi:MAG TPA: MBL fold metallo-hydrolase, partial [Pilimelia sp.]|nr:MBL fold metallo-hydrolase [Pilimelia sp.]